MPPTWARSCRSSSSVGVRYPNPRRWDWQIMNSWQTLWRQPACGRKIFDGPVFFFCPDRSGHHSYGWTSLAGRRTSCIPRTSGWTGFLSAPNFQWISSNFLWISLNFSMNFAKSFNEFYKIFIEFNKIFIEFYHFFTKISVYLVVFHSHLQEFFPRAKFLPKTNIK